MSTDMSDHTILKRISKNRPLASRISWLAVAALAALFVTPSQPALAAARPQTLHGQATPSVHGVPVVGRPRPAQLTHGPRQTSHADVHWPAAGTATVDLAAATNPMTAARSGGKGSAASVRAGSLSVWTR